MWLLHTAEKRKGGLPPTPPQQDSSFFALVEDTSLDRKRLFSPLPLGLLLDSSAPPKVPQADRSPKCPQTLSSSCEVFP